MQNKIQVKSVETRENALIFCAENTEIEVKELSARNHVLVDSDNLSFLYILENESSFILCKYSAYMLGSNAWSDE